MRPALFSVLPRPPHPTRDGLAIRNFYLLRALAEEFLVRAFTLLPAHLAQVAAEYPNGVQVETVPQASRALRRVAAVASSLLRGRAYSPRLYRSRALRARLRRAAQLESPAWIVAHSYHVGPLALGQGRPAWIDFHNVDSEIWRRMGETARSTVERAFTRWQAPRVEAFERSLLSQAAGASCVSERDARVLSSFARSSPLVVPNGVDLERYTFRAEPAPEEVVFFVGDLTWPPNVEGVRWFCAEVWPRLVQLRPSARAEILGRSPPTDLRDIARQGLPGVSFLGEGEDTRPHWRRAAVAVVPLLAGGGTRLKILEAAACGVPVVSTSVGAEGLDFSDGVEILLRDDAEDFADTVARLLADRAARLHQAAAARTLVEQKYGWKGIGARFARELLARANVV